MTTFPSGFKRQTRVSNNVPSEHVGIIDAKIDEYLNQGILEEVAEEEVEFVAPLSVRLLKKFVVLNSRVSKISSTGNRTRVARVTVWNATPIPCPNMFLVLNSG